MFKTLKAAIGNLMRHPSGAGSYLVRLPRTKYDYAQDIGDGTSSSVVMAPIQWIQRTLPEAPITVSNRKGRIVGHELEILLNHPNDFYSGTNLWAGTIFSWCTTGNAYWLKVRNSIGTPVQLWFIPPWMIEPKWPTQGSAANVFISHYEYRPGGGQTIDLDPEDVVHFCCGIDPSNPRLGLSPLASVLREVWSDDESSNWVASLLRNSGVPGVVVSPEANTTVGIGDVEQVKKYIRDQFTGDRRGEPLVMSGPTKVSEFGYDPKKMDLSGVRNTAEERCCALLGISPAVIGFGTGLESATNNATMTELSRMAWVNCIVPMQTQFASEIERSLLVDFEMFAEGFEVAFDRSKIAALQDNQTDLFTRANIGVTGGWLTVAQAKQMVGAKPQEGDEVYLRNPNMIEVPKGLTVADVQAENEHITKMAMNFARGGVRRIK